MVKPASSVVRAFTAPRKRAVRGVVLHTVHRVRQTLRTAGSADEQVELHVHQAGQQRDVAEVDLVVESAGTLSGIHRRDPVAVDHHHRR